MRGGAIVSSSAITALMIGNALSHSGNSKIFSYAVVGILLGYLLGFCVLAIIGMCSVIRRCIRTIIHKMQENERIKNTWEAFDRTANVCREIREYY